MKILIFFFLNILRRKINETKTEKGKSDRLVIVLLHEMIKKGVEDYIHEPINYTTLLFNIKLENNIKNLSVDGMLEKGIHLTRKLSAGIHSHLNLFEAKEPKKKMLRVWWMFLRKNFF